MREARRTGWRAGTPGSAGPGCCQAPGVNVPSVGTDLTAALAAADLTLLLVGHREYEADILASHARMLLDACGRVRELTLTRPPACFEVL